MTITQAAVISNGEFFANHELVAEDGGLLREGGYMNADWSV